MLVPAAVGTMFFIVMNTANLLAGGMTRPTRRSELVGNRPRILAKRSEIKI